MIPGLLVALEFVWENRDLIAAIAGAIERGVKKEDIQHAIEALEVQISDEAMREELSQGRGPSGAV